MITGKVFVAGHAGLVGSALVRRLDDLDDVRLICRNRADLDLGDGRAVHDFFRRERPDYVFLAAAKVGGILANRDFPADFIRENLQIQLAVIDAAYQSGVSKLMFFGSSCAYPRLATQPIKEESLLQGALEPTNEAYAVAKIAGIKLCQAYNQQYGTEFISVMPTNLYGPGDNFDLDSSHVLAALMRKCHEAKVFGCDKVEVWGTGLPRREFLHVDDLAEACVFLIDNYSGSEVINIGTGEDVSIVELTQLIAEVVGYEGEFSWDRSKPDGTPQKLLDVSKIDKLGWTASIGLTEGLRQTYTWFESADEWAVRR